MRQEPEVPQMSPAMLTERDKLPSELRPYFDSLVETYKYHALISHGSPFVSYKVLACLVREGWRKSADPSD